MRFRFIEDRRADYPVTILCDVLGVSPARYCAWRSRPESRRSTANRRTHSVTAPGQVALGGQLICTQAAWATLWGRQFQGRSSWMRLAG